MSQKLQKIVELSIELGKANLILANKNDQIAEMEKYFDNQQTSIQNLTSNIHELAEQRKVNLERIKEITDINEDLSGKLEGKNRVIDSLNATIKNLRNAAGMSNEP